MFKYFSEYVSENSNSTSKLLFPCFYVMMCFDSKSLSVRTNGTVSHIIHFALNVLTGKTAKYNVKCWYREIKALSKRVH